MQLEDSVVRERKQAEFPESIFQLGRRKSVNI